MIDLLFHGAAGEVTGSMHLLRWRGRWLSLDCGLFQGRRAESEAKNRTWPMPPSDISAVLLSHAHIDHTGRLPKLARDGFDGPIYCTAATRDLAAVMLPDSAHIQEEDVVFLNKRRARKQLPPVEPLYTNEDALAAVKLMQTFAYGRWFSPLEGLRARYHDAGHMLGSGYVEMEFDLGGGRSYTLLFSGDVGREKTPILRDPSRFPPADAVILESTYGGRVNETPTDAEATLADVVRRTIERGGKVIIPAFSVGRTQTIVYFLHDLMTRGRIPRMPVFIDSPLAVNATEVFKLHPECYDIDARKLHDRDGGLLGGECCVYIEDVDESKALNKRQGPCVIISASGMAESGRVRHHLYNNLGSGRNTVLLPGYQAENTLGRKLADGAETVNIFNEAVRVRAEVVQIHGFSNHADQRELIAHMAPLTGRTQSVFLVHGELEQSQALAGKLREQGFPHVTIAAPGKQVTLASGDERSRA